MAVTEGKKAASCAGNYQDAATALLDRDLDNDTTTWDDGESDPATSSHTMMPDSSGGILPGINKEQLEPHHINDLNFLTTCSFVKLSAFPNQALSGSNNG